jgi:NADPH-dependent glutamate synthase beta subunit-like oxidoreductase/formate hydrogenlyase subunit 6/NADH:ubiquinone oxidoreductase subunit I
MLRLGVPEYRLPRELLESEIQAILSLGPRIEYEKALGIDFSIQDLRSEFDAIFLAIGTHRSRALNIEGEQQDGVLRAVDFLLNVNLRGYNLDLGRKIVVIGGGNVAMDVARTAARLGQPAESGGDLELALDVARAARRLGTTQEVHCLVVEGRHEMLADSFEIEEAEAEGIVIHNQVAPRRILGEERSATGVETLSVSRTFDDDGRFNPQLLPNTEQIWPCNSVIVAIGQLGELDWIHPEDHLEVTPQGTLQVDPETFTTSSEGIFAGGDIAFGPRLIINAVADGQRAAVNIDTYLRGTSPHRVRTATFTPIDRSSEMDAQDQAVRCLVCSLNPIFDSDLCILCNGCVDVCPMDCLKLVPVSELDGDEKVAALIQAIGGNQATAMLLDPEHCIRCGLCADRCPTEAVVMHAFHFQEALIYEEIS